MKIKVYLASKLHHSQMVRDLIIENTHDVTWTNRWQWFESKVPDEKDFAQHFWENDFDDVDAADAVLVYGEGDDTLKGAILEAGYAIGKGKPVVIVGSSKSFGTWQYSQRVQRAETIVDALHLIGASQ